MENKCYYCRTEVASEDSILIFVGGQSYAVCIPCDDKVYANAEDYYESGIDV